MYNPRISVVFKETRQKMATFETTYQHIRDEKSTTLCKRHFARMRTLVEFWKSQWNKCVELENAETRAFIIFIYLLICKLSFRYSRERAV